jgi:hypothetical protein
VDRVKTLSEALDKKMIMVVELEETIKIKEKRVLEKEDEILKTELLILANIDGLVEKMKQ